MHDGIDAVVSTAALWKARNEQRRWFRQLDAHLLNDIGIDRKQMLCEKSKPFWRD